MTVSTGRLFVIMKVLCCGNCNRPVLPAQQRRCLQVIN